VGADVLNPQFLPKHSKDGIFTPMWVIILCLFMSIPLWASRSTRWYPQTGIQKTFFTARSSQISWSLHMYLALARQNC